MSNNFEEATRMIPKTPTQVVTIDDDASLMEFINCLQDCDWLALDTEFLREKTYFPKLCLLQIASEHHIGLIDTLAIRDHSPIIELLTCPTITKVIHSAGQDLEALHHRYGIIPGPIFDTQLAAALLGFDNQVSYARLVEHRLGLQLAKAHTRTDWSRRPLSAGALQYAADDVRYLAAIYPVLHRQLAEAKRLAWLNEDMQQNLQPERFQIQPRQAWRRLKNWYKLVPQAQQILAELATWREQEALDQDRPRRWILADDAIMALAEQQPANDMALADMTELPARTAAQHAEALLACIKRGRQRPATILDPNAGPPDTQTRRQIKKGMQALGQAAEAADLPRAVLANRAEIAAIVAGKRAGRLFTGWRWPIAGQQVVVAIEQAQQQTSS